MNIQERIEKLEKELAKLKEEAIVKPWEPIGGQWFVNAGGLIHEGFRTLQHREFGAERPTEKLAKRASIMMRRFNRLLAYHDEFCPEHDPAGDWGNDADNWTICRNTDESPEWHVTNVWVLDHVTVYFSEDVAIELCRRLNAGEVVL